jgi:outer membrane protein assembly factor BamB
LEADLGVGRWTKLDPMSCRSCWSLALVMLCGCAAPPRPLHAEARAVSWAWAGSDIVVANSADGATLARVSPDDSAPDAALLGDGALYTVAGSSVWAAQIPAGSTLFRHESEDGDYLPLLAQDDIHLYAMREPSGDERQARLVALDKRDGSTVWTAIVEGLSQDDAVVPLVAGGLVVASAGATLVAFERHRGEPRWIRPTPSAVVSTTVGGTQIYSIDEDGVLAALASSDGHTLWSLALGVASTDGWSRRPVLSATAERVVVTRGQHLTALDPLSGGTLWRGPRVESVVVGEGVAFAALDGARHAMVDLIDGSLRWERDLDLAVAPTLAESDQLVLVRPRNAEIQAYDLNRGRRRWTLPL